MAMLRQVVGLVRRRSTPAAAVSPLLRSRTTTVGLAHLRSARLSHPPPSASSPRFLSTNESSSTREQQLEQQLELHKEKSKEELINMYVRIHCKGLGVPDPSKAKVELNEVLAKWEASMEERSSIVKKDMVSSGEGASAGEGRPGWTRQQMLDRVAAPLSCVIMFFYCLRCQYPV